MSTEPRRRTRYLGAALGLLAAACVHRVSTNIQALCSGADVARNLALVIDSVTPDAPPGLARLRGDRFDIVLNLFNHLSGVHCQDRFGTASASVSQLPDALERAAPSKRNARWWVEGLHVTVSFNPGAVDDNLQFRLPLNGGVGRWWLSTLAGPVATGRLLPASGE